MTKEEKLQVIAPLLLKVCQKILWRLETNSDLSDEEKYRSINDLILDMCDLVNLVNEGI